MVLSFLKSCPVFHGLTGQELIEIEQLSEKQAFEAGIEIIDEGDTSTDLYVILEGEVEVLKSEQIGDRVVIFPLATLSAKDIFGEISFVDYLPRSSTIQALTWTQALRLNRNQLQTHAPLLYQRIVANVTRMSLVRVREFNAKYTKTLEEQLHQFKIRQHFADFFMIVIFILAFTDMLGRLAIVLHVDEKNFVFSWTMLLSIALPFVYFIKKFRYPLSAFGVTLKGWKMALIEGTKFGILACAVFLIVYIFVMYDVLDKSVFYHFTHHPDFKWDLVFFYPIHAYIQEFIARGVFQTSLKRFLYDQSGKLSVFLTSLIFAIKHLHIGLPLVIATFVGSMFFGWIYLRRANLIEVTTVHFIVGVLALLLLKK